MTFGFEADFIASLRCIPMAVRLSLDTCGLKLTLTQWHQLTPVERAELVTLSCATPSEIQAYRAYLCQILTAHTGHPPQNMTVDPVWLCNDLPSSVQDQAAQHAIQLTDDQWVQLSPQQRFALLKLSRAGHENRNFLPALWEFQLVSHGL
ncbi:nitrate reductase associated protein [Candidatus Cyanaurora vandensis]|uniref:nitrate reductase associated protein n=1 Tax=Candidatus Cyanaurora vandensis TaxID=2714958 RepID=UPI00257C7BA9|nr:nitrate reductase associated protein [Candidatus Cyanaurora vandensis]